MIDKIYSKKIIFNDILMTIAPSVKSYLPGPQRGGGGQYMMQSWTRKYIVKSLKCLYMYLWNKKFVNVTHTKCGAPWGKHMFKKTYSEWNNLF